MIKIDELKVKSELKKRIIPISLIAVIVSVYSLLTIIPALIKIKKKYVYLGYTCVVAISMIWISVVDYSLTDFISSYFLYGKYLFLIDPVRLIISSAYGIYIYITLDICYQRVLMTGWYRRKKNS